MSPLWTAWTPGGLPRHPVASFVLAKTPCGIGTRAQHHERRAVLVGFRLAAPREVHDSERAVVEASQDVVGRRVEGVDPVHDLVTRPISMSTAGPGRAGTSS